MIHLHIERFNGKIISTMFSRFDMQKRTWNGLEEGTRINKEVAFDRTQGKIPGNEIHGLL